MKHVNPLVLVVDDEPDVEVLFRQQFRRDLRGPHGTSAHHRCRRPVGTLCNS